MPKYTLTTEGGVSKRRAHFRELEGGFLKAVFARKAVRILKAEFQSGRRQISE